MTIISWEMSKKIRKNFEDGLRMRCFENVRVPATKWKEILERLGIPDSPQWDTDFERCLWKHPSKELELRTDVIPDGKQSISIIDFYGMKEDFETFLKESNLEEKK